jgi:hypothetical protein
MFQPLRYEFFPVRGFKNSKRVHLSSGSGGFECGCGVTVIMFFLLIKKPEQNIFSITNYCTIIFLINFVRLFSGVKAIGLICNLVKIKRLWQ